MNPGDSTGEVFESSSATALVLAGGRATRMGGTDKGLVPFNGVPMAQRIADSISNQGVRVLINANRNFTHYQAFGYEVIGDSLENYQGPLAGFLCGLENLVTPWMITLPCDGPLLATDYFDRMLKTAIADQNRLAVAWDGQRLQPVYALIHADLRQDLQLFLQSGERKIDRWYDRHRFSRVDFSDTPWMFENVNTPEQLANLEMANQQTPR